MTSASPFASHVAALIVAATIGAALLACDDSQLAGAGRQADSVSGDIVGDTLLDSSSDDDTGADAAVDGNPDVEIPVPDIDGSADTAADIGVDVVGDDDVVFCGQDEDCPSALCYLPISSPDLGVCTALCTSDDNCPDDWRCVQDQSAGGDAVRICVPTDLCIDADQDGRGYGPGCIATDCDENDPTTYVGASELCDGLDNDCDDVVDEEPVDENDDCTTSFSGVCAPGRTRCIDGLFECQSNVAAGEEVCDGLDNDCDGLIDEDVDGDPLTRPCYSGPQGTAGVGLCVSGTATCEAGIYDGCEGATLPATELCDGFDNDCDGTADEDEPGAGEVCSTGLGGACDISTTVCVDGALLCPPSSDGRIEICDGIDNDCDREIDEGNPGGGDLCGTGLLGVCAAGTRTCQAGSLVCIVNTTGSEEICDGLDNDCDGTADEGNPGGGTECDTGALGVCSAGILECGTAGVVCSPVATATEEVCDGLDNDCDGEIDEDTADAGLTCSTSLPGVCAPGLTVCNAGEIECEADELPVADVCDGLDNDCDGRVDEENPGGGLDCDTGVPGVCSAGLTECFSGAVRCVQSVASRPELCDGLDNDCDGTADEENPGGGLNCNSGEPGICAPGTTVCEAGAIACYANNAPATEICNGLDDNCDGSADEGNPGGGRNCSTGIPGICSAGQTACEGGSIQCEQVVEPVAEVCDGLDNDCDGATDENNPGGGAACSTGVPGVCSAGTLTCTAGALACAQTTASSAEVCDGLDNDCDGSADEGNPGGGLNCTSSEPGICSAGRTACVDGGVECQSVVDPVTEVCNGLDDDCDGAVDNGNPGGGRVCSTGLPGICSAGTTSCDGGAIQCDQNLTPVPDVCDGLDNDCDGATDEGNPGGGGACDTGQLGVCAAGILNCSGGALACTRTTGPSVEICDGIDNDCDGQIDEGNPGGGVSCATGQSGVCSAGTTVCSAGAVTCERNVAPSADICDGLDNDCDGSVDEGNPGGGASCSTGQQGVCSAGTTSCSAGALVCNRNTSPSADVCDGLDNDCDGATDEGNPGGGLSCSTGQQGVCSAGTTVCSGGAIACTRNTAPSTDICDGIDNDCDGSADEGNPGGGANCSTGLPGVCSAGTSACSGGALVCNQNTSPSSDICDGIDNDCDGATDEGNPGGGLSCSTGQAGICSAGTTACSGGGIVCNRNNSPVGEICDAFDNDCDGSTNEQCPSGFRTGFFTTSPQFADLDGGTSFSSTCPSGSYAVGFYGRAAARIDQVGTRCASMTFSTSTATTPYTYALNRGTTTSATAYGGGGGSPVTRDCPSGSFMIGLAGRAGDRMDQMQALCGRFTVTGSPGSYVVTRTTTTSTATAGGTGGSAFSYTCPGNGVVAFIQGRSGSEVDSAYVRCVTLLPNLIP